MEGSPRGDVLATAVQRAGRCLGKAGVGSRAGAGMTVSLLSGTMESAVTEIPLGNGLQFALVALQGRGRSPLATNSL